MSSYELYRFATRRHRTDDPLRALLLILVTVIVAFAFARAVPDRVWAELSAPQSYGFVEWHGNVMRAGPHN